MTTPFPAATITGYPRIGRRRELKTALESLWAGRIDTGEFAQTTRSCGCRPTTGRANSASPRTTRSPRPTATTTTSSTPRSPSGSSLGDDGHGLRPR